jgi:hypothetical protein
MASSSRPRGCWRSLKAAIAVSVMLASWETQAAPITLDGYKISFENIEQNPDGIYGTLSSQNVISNASLTSPDMLRMNPTALTVQADNDWRMRTSTGRMNFLLQAKPGFALNTVDLSAAGQYILLLSQVRSATFAYAGSDIALSLQIISANGISQNLRPLPFNKDNGLLVTNPDGFTLSGIANGGPHDQSWAASFSKSVMGAGGLAEMSGLAQNSLVTEISVSLQTNLYVEAEYATATSQTDLVTVGGTVQPVPEPPTIILAGLGAAAAVGHGYRRRKLRQRDAEGSDAEWNGEEGAIALTA